MTTTESSFRDSFEQAFGRAPSVVARAPGRLEILGNHTDYNEGVVLSVAVDRATTVAAAPAADPHRCRLRDLHHDSERTFDPSDLDNPEPGDWANYIKGIVRVLQDQGHTIPAFDLALTSTVPMSAGMSSSAALEMSSLLAIERIAGVTLGWRDRARAGQACENHYVGANTGLMDQFTSLCGEAGHFVFSDFRSLDVETVSVPDGLALVVANTKVKHVLTGAYNERRERCEQAVCELRNAGVQGVAALRDVSSDLLREHRGALDITAYRRACHVVGENERVLGGIEDLRAGRIEAFGKKLFASHESSRTDFENSCEELDILVELARSLPGCYGARLSGGGFGGITVHLVDAPKAEGYAQRLATAYKTRTDSDCDVMILHPGDGACVLEPKA